MAEKVQLTLIGSRPCAFQQATYEPYMLPLTPPKGGTKRDFAVFGSKIQLLLKKVFCKVFCVKTSCSEVVATSFLYLTVYRCIAGDDLCVAICIKFALKVTQPFRKC